MTDSPDTMLDVLASHARTALDDPGALTGDLAEWQARGGPSRYAIDKLDEIIAALNPALETRETFAATLTILGRHLAERQDLIEQTHDDDEQDADRLADAAKEIGAALDSLDAAIAALTAPDEPDPDGRYAIAWDYEPDNPNPHPLTLSVERFTSYAAADGYASHPDTGNTPNYYTVIETQ